VSSANKDTFISIGSDMGITTTVKAFGHRFKMGGVSTTLLGVGTYEEVYQAATQCIEEGQTLPAGFALMPACEMPVLAPPLNVQALVD
jgi:uroporphyrinogen-III decarboxylase